MKAIAETLYIASPTESVVPVARYVRMRAKELQLRECWFRDAIHTQPDLVIGPCRAAGRVSGEEAWLPWGKEVAFGAGPVDVLLVSSFGRVGIVETKLSYNPEKRREVVAQILDYALALQECGLEELPNLPGGEFSPDAHDVRDAIAAGRFLLVIAGDTLDPRALRLGQSVLGRHLTSEWDLAMIDLNVYRQSDALGELLLVPELLGTVSADIRNVVRVQVDGDTQTRVRVEHVEQGSAADVRRPKIGNVDEFLHRAAARSPGVERHLADVIEYWSKIAASTGRFRVGLESSTANLYWQAPDGSSRRIFALRDAATMRVWVHYLSGSYADRAVEVARMVGRIKPIEPGKQSVAVPLTESSLSGVKSLIDEITQFLSA